MRETYKWVMCRTCHMQRSSGVMSARVMSRVNMSSGNVASRVAVRPGGNASIWYAVYKAAIILVGRGEYPPAGSWEDSSRSLWSRSLFSTASYSSDSYPCPSSSELLLAAFSRPAVSACSVHLSQPCRLLLLRSMSFPPHNTSNV